MYDIFASIHIRIKKLLNGPSNSGFRFKKKSNKNLHISQERFLLFKH